MSEHRHTAAPSPHGRDGPAASSSSAPAPPGSPPPTSSPRRASPRTVLEADDMVGGISRTVRARRVALRHRRPPLLHQGQRVEDFWHEILDDDEFLLRPRSSRIYYQGKFYDYPIKPLNALRNLGPDRGGPLRPVVPVGAGAPAEGPVDARGLHRRQLRLAPLLPLLQDLQREGLGRPAVGDLGRLGRPAHQGHVAVERRVGAAPGPRSPARRKTGPSRSPA